MIIEDFVMLGRTVPEPSKKYGTAVCSAGYSKELRQFIRIYPLRTEDKIPRWTMAVLPAERNSRDWRKESWKLKHCGEYQLLDKAVKDAEFDFLKTLKADSIKQLNEERMSLAVIQPYDINGYNFTALSQDEESQIPLFDDERAISDLVPRITFTDSGGRHTLQLRDWGAYEYMRKFPDNLEGLWSNLHFNDPDYEHLFFIGNHLMHPTSWLVIAALSKLKDKNLDLFSEAA